MSLAFPSIPFLLTKLLPAQKHTEPSECVESPRRKEAAGSVGCERVAAFWISRLELDAGFWEAVTSLYDKWVSKKARSSGEAELLTVSVSSTPGPLKARAQINLDECDRFGQRKFAEINKRTRAA